jgi:anti-anti-sigma factor
MKIRTQDYNNVTVVEVKGELETDYTEMFKNTVSTLVEQKKKGIVLDMTETGFIDSVGLETLLWARDHCNENDCQLRLAGLDENCAKILEVTRLNNEFDTYDELAGAVKSFA